MTKEPVGVLVAAALVAVGVRFFWSTVFTAIADYADGSSGGWAPDTWYAVANGARTAGLAVGGLVTGVVVADGRAGTFRAVAYAAVACFAAAALLIAVYVRTPTGRHRDDEERRDAGYRMLVRDRPFLALLSLNTVSALASMMLGLALPTVVQRDLQAAAWLTAAVLAGNAILITIASGPVGARLPRHRRTRVIALAAALWTVWALSLAALGPGRQEVAAVVLIAATLLFTAAELLHAPASTTLAAAVAPAGARGRYLAVFQYSFALASIIAPAFFAALFALDTDAPWLALALLTALSAAAVLLVERALPIQTLRDTMSPRPPSRHASADLET